MKQVVVILKFQPNELSTQKSKTKVTVNPTFTGNICGIFSRCLLALCQGFGILAVLLLTLPGTEVAGCWVVPLDENHFDSLDIINVGRVNQNSNTNLMLTVWGFCCE